MVLHFILNIVPSYVKSTCLYFIYHSYRNIYGIFNFHLLKRRKKFDSFTHNVSHIALDKSEQHLYCDSQFYWWRKL